MPQRDDLLDLAALRLRPGEGRRIELDVTIEPLELGAERYPVVPRDVPVRVDIARMTSGGYSLRLRFTAEVHGTCMRCLGEASPAFDVDAREIDQADGGPELDSPYVEADVLDLGAWSRDALLLALPAQVLCTPDCAGLCPECGERLADLPPDHAHERTVDPRWAKLGELRFD